MKLLALDLMQQLHALPSTKCHLVIKLIPANYRDFPFFLFVSDDDRFPRSNAYRERSREEEKEEDQISLHSSSVREMYNHVQLYGSYIKGTISPQRSQMYASKRQGNNYWLASEAKLALFEVAPLEQ